MADDPRYARQVRLPEIGDAGQRRLGEGHVLVVGCGALGSVVVELLARAGVGTITVVDRDVVDVGNLHRQFLFDEEDARRGTPKAEAAKARVARLNPSVRVRSFYDDFSPRNAERYAEGTEVIVDGLDNLESRYLLNDLAVARGLPYVYGAAVGTEGMLAVVRPGATACLRCLFPEVPPPGALPTCESAGVLGSLTALVASREATETIKILVGAAEACETGLLAIDPWRNRERRIDLAAARDPDCPCCGRREFAWLRGDRWPRVVSLCGRNTVQVTPTGDAAPPDLDVVATRLAAYGTPERSDDAVRVTLAGEAIELTVFRDGRTVVRGTADAERGRSIVARYVGV